MARKAVRCFCGFKVESDDDDQSVAAIQGHARQFHNAEFTRD